MELIDIFKSEKKNVIYCIILNMIAAIFSVAASLSLTLFVQRIIEGKYIEAMYMILLNLGLYIVAYSFNYIYLIQKNKAKMLGTLKYYTDNKKFKIQDKRKRIYFKAKQRRKSN